MNNKDDIEKLLYLLGEENTIEELKYPKRKHKFSEEYERRKVEMIKKYNDEGEKSPEIVTTDTMKSRKRKWKKSIILAASITAVIGISLTAYGIAEKYEIKTNRDKETGTFTMDVKPTIKNDKIPEIKIIPGYLPEGYIESENSPGKYHPNGDNSSGGITIYSAVDVNSFKDSYVSSVEETTIGGVKAKILTRDGIEYNHIIYLLYEDEGQIIKIYGAEIVPLDELIKVAENITYEEIPGSFVDVPAYSADSESNDEKVIEVINPEIKDKNLFGINEVRNDFNTMEMADVKYTVKSIDVLDKLQEIEPEYFCKVENVLDEYDTYLQYINEDGTLKEHERVNAEHWENNKMNRETEIVGMKFVYVTVEVTNTSEEDIIDQYFAPRIIYLEENSNHVLEEMWKYLDYHELQMEDRPFYFDKGDYQGKHYYFADFKAKETYEIHLAYAVDEDYLDNAYISFNSTRHTILNPREASESYIKVAK